MNNRIEDIKINNYRLPTIDDINSGDLYRKDDISERSVQSPIFQSRKE